MKIALLLPQGENFDHRWRAASLARSLETLTAPDGSKVEVIIGLPVASGEVWRNQEAALLRQAPFVTVRHLTWERVQTAVIERMYPDRQIDFTGVEEAVIPRDWGWNFMDCDGWIIFGDCGQGATPPLRPTAVLVRDLAARYVPQAFAQNIHDVFWARQLEALRMWRQALAVCVSDDATRSDAAGYGGIRADRLVKTPRLLPPENSAPETPRKPREFTLVWMPRMNPGHNIEAALEGLRKFLAGRASPARIIIAGDDARRFDPEEGDPAMAPLPAQLKRLAATLEYEACLSEDDLWDVLANADAIWSSALADGENEGLAWAARAGLPFVGMRYPQNETMAIELGVNAIFHDGPGSSAIAHALTAQSLSATRSKPSRCGDEAGGWSEVVERLWGASNA